MARSREPTADQEASWLAWVAKRPPAIRAMVEKHGINPWTLYRLTTGPHRVTIYSIDEPKDGSPPTLQVEVTGRFNFVAFERRVFGIKPEELIECDLPGPFEKLGSADISIELADQRN